MKIIPVANGSTPTHLTVATDTDGPLTFSIKGDFIAANVTVGEVRRAEMTLATDDPDDGPGARVIADTQIKQIPGGIHVDVPKLPGQQDGFTSTTFVGRGGATTVISGNVVAGGTVIVNGRLISAGGAGATSKGIRVQLRLPSNSTLKIRTDNSPSFGVTGHPLAAVDYGGRNGSLDLHATVADLGFDSHNGDLTASARVQRLDASTHNGDIHVDELYGDGRASTHNGDLSIAAYAPGRIKATSHNGSVRVSDPNRLGPARLHINANSHNGRVRTPH